MRAALSSDLTRAAGTVCTGRRAASAPRPSVSSRRSYSDYGVYESPLEGATSEGGQDTGEENEPGQPLSMEEQQQNLIGVLGDQYRQARQGLGDKHPDTVRSDLIADRPARLTDALLSVPQVAALGKFVEHGTGMATMFLETGRGGDAWELLSDVHKAAKRQPALLPGVQNSMACCLRRAGRLRAAENLLQKAVRRAQIAPFYVSST